MRGLAARCPSHGSCSVAAWLAAAALCTACSFTPRVAPVTAWGMFPMALAAWLAAHKDQGGSPQLKQGLDACFYFTFVATKAAASIIGVFGILQGPGVPPLAGHVALVPICTALWLVLALSFALHVAFARRRVVMSPRPAAVLSIASLCRFPGSPMAVLTGPVAWTAAWTVIGELSPIGAFASPAATQAQTPFAQLAAVLGGDGIVFVLAWPGAALWYVLQLAYCAAKADLIRHAFHRLQHGRVWRFDSQSSHTAPLHCCRSHSSCAAALWSCAPGFYAQHCCTAIACHVSVARGRCRAPVA